MITPAQMAAAAAAIADFVQKLDYLEAQVAILQKVEQARMAQYLARCTAKYSNGHARPAGGSPQ